MQENKFEQEMEQQMKGLQLRPSDDVWKKVEEELHKKKRRRFVIFFFMLAAVGLMGYAGYTLLVPAKPFLAEEKSYSVKQKEIPGHGQLPVEKESRKPKEIVNSTTLVVTNREDVKKTPTELQNKKENVHIPSAVDKIDNTGNTGINGSNKSETPADAKNKQAKLLSGKSNQQTTYKQKKFPVKREVADNLVQKKETATEPTNNTLMEKNSIPSTDVMAVVSDKKKNEQVTAKKNVTEEAEAVRITTSSDDIVATEKSKQIITAVIDTAVTMLSTDTVNVPVTITAAQKKKKAIKWGVEWSVGSSKGSTSILPLFSSAEKALMDRNGNLYSSPVTSGGSTGAISPVGPSSISSGFSYRAGVLGQLPLGRRTGISAGIRYAYMSDRITIGGYRDSNYFFNNFAAQTVDVRAAYLYTGATRQSFTNRYHFLQVPVQFEWQLNKGKKVPVSWHTGISAGYLVATNALVYDTSFGGIYYYSKQAFNRLQINLNTGIAFQVGSKRKVKWSLGPEISISTSQLMKEAYDSRRYLLFGGLTGRFIFTKSKK